MREDGERQESGTIGEEERDCEEGKGRKVTGENMLHFYAQLIHDCKNFNFLRAL